MDQWNELRNPNKRPSLRIGRRKPQGGGRMTLGELEYEPAKILIGIPIYKKRLIKPNVIPTRAKMRGIRANHRCVPV